MNGHKGMNEELQQITLAYVEGRGHGDGQTLEDLVKAYPHYASELIEFATTYYMTEELKHDETTQTVIERDELELERRVLDETFTQLRHPPALTSLLGRAQQRGYDAPALAAELDLGLDVVEMLDMRVLTDVAHPPLLERLSRILAASMQQLQTFFSQSPTPALAHFYAEKPPTMGQRQSFVEAVRSSRMMTTEQRARWLTLLGERDSGGPPTARGKRPKQRRRG